MHGSRRSSVLRGRAALVTVLSTVLLTATLALASPADAGSVARSWIARPGSDGANGVIRLVLHSRTIATIMVGLRGLPAGTVVAGTIRRGTCASPGSVVAPLPGGRTTADGRISKWGSTTARQATAIAASSSLVATIRAGSFRRCAAFVEQIAARPSPSPTPAPTVTPAPTPTPGPPGPPIQVGQRFLSGGDDAFWLRVDRVDGTSSLYVTITIEARVDGTVIREDDFRLVEQDGTTRGPDTPAFWSLTTRKGQYYVRGLAYVAPASGALDLRYRTLVIHIRN